MATWKRGRNPTTRHANIVSQPASYIYSQPATIASLWSEGLLGPTDQLVKCNSLGLISLLFFQCRIAFYVNTCHVISDISRCSPCSMLEIVNCSNLTIAFYPLGNFRQALCIKSCLEDLVLTRKRHNCTGIAFIQGDSAGASKLIEQTLP